MPILGRAPVTAKPFCHPLRRIHNARQWQGLLANSWPATRIYPGFGQALFSRHGVELLLRLVEPQLQIRQQVLLAE
jgi:hypothetical protein